MVDQRHTFDHVWYMRHVGADGCGKIGYVYDRRVHVPFEVSFFAPDGLPITADTRSGMSNIRVQCQECGVVGVHGDTFAIDVDYHRAVPLLRLAAVASRMQTVTEAGEEKGAAENEPDRQPVKPVEGSDACEVDGKPLRDAPYG